MQRLPLAGEKAFHRRPAVASNDVITTDEVTYA